MLTRRIYYIHISAFHTFDYINSNDNNDEIKRPIRQDKTVIRHKPQYNSDDASNDCSYLKTLF